MRLHKSIVNAVIIGYRREHCSSVGCSDNLICILSKIVQDKVRFIKTFLFSDSDESNSRHLIHSVILDRDMHFLFSSYKGTFQTDFNVISAFIYSSVTKNVDAFYRS